jgi:hypothetical protein
MFRKRRRLGRLATTSVASCLALAGCSVAPPSPVASVVEPVVAPDGVLLQQGGAPILFYRSRPEPGREPWRVHYLHPLHSAAGEVLTEDAPADHPHQRGVFWAWRRILVDGVPVADGWVGRDFALQVAPPAVTVHADGSAEIRAQARWVVPVDGRESAVIDEHSTIRAFPLSAGTRRIDIDLRLTALRPGVALAGTDDDKGYGGLSFRLRDATALAMRSDGRELRATVARMPVGAVMDFAWGHVSSLPSTGLSIACRVNGRPWTEWVLRQEPSMQNCAFPGRTPFALPLDEALHLSATLSLR